MTILEALRTLIGAERDVADPTVVQVRYPEHHPLAGGLAGLLVRKGTGVGASVYEAHKLGGEDPGPVVAVLERRHFFGAPKDMAGYIAAAGVAGMAFVDVARSVATVRFLAPDRPEAGVLTSRIDEHRHLSAFRAIVGGGWKELTHVAFAELLMDREQEVLTEFAVASVAVFRAAKKIEYDADMDGAGSSGVRVSWGPAADPGTVAVNVPREIKFRIPMWEDTYPTPCTAILRVRVVAPKEKDAVAPVFRVLWLNEADFEADMAREAKEIVENALKAHSGGAPVHVFEGTPNAIHRVAGHER